MSCRACKKEVVYCLGPRGATGVQGATGPASGTNDLIKSAQNEARVQCFDSGFIGAFCDAELRFAIQSNGDTTLTCGVSGNSNRLDMNVNKVGLYFGTTPVLLAQGTTTSMKSVDGTKQLDVDVTGVQIQNAYYLPNVAGTAGQVLTSNGPGVSTWTTPAGLFGLYSQTVPTTISSTNEEPLTIQANGVGTLTIPSNSITPGECFQYRTGGSLTVAAAGQIVEFKFYSNFVLLFASGSIPVESGTNAWTIDMTFTYVGNTNPGDSVTSNFGVITRLYQ